MLKQLGIIDSRLLLLNLSLIIYVVNVTALVDGNNYGINYSSNLSYNDILNL